MLTSSRRGNSFAGTRPGRNRHVRAGTRHEDPLQSCYATATKPMTAGPNLSESSKAFGGCVVSEITICYRDRVCASRRRQMKRRARGTQTAGSSARRPRASYYAPGAGRETARPASFLVVVRDPVARLLRLALVGLPWWCRCCAGLPRGASIVFSRIAADGARVELSGSSGPARRRGARDKARNSMLEWNCIPPRTVATRWFRILTERVRTTS